MQLAPKQWLNIQEDDLVWATAAPVWQKWVWSPFLSIMGSGATAFVYNGKFKASRYLELLQDFKINVLCCTPTEYRMMAKLNNLDSYDLSHLRSAVSAGEPLNRDVVDKFEQHFGLTVRDGYGQTESTLLIGFLEDTPKRPGAMGKAIPGTGVTIIDDDGTELGLNEEGNIAVPLDLPALFKGYLNDEAVRKKLVSQGITSQATWHKKMQTVIFGLKDVKMTLLLARAIRFGHLK